MGLIDELAARYKNFVFLGETGSGKTEAALNLAAALAQRGDREVHFFDMDQTKPLFRARDAAEAVPGVVLHSQFQYLDTPNVVPGINEALANPRRYAILDVGGGDHGSHMVGQFSRALNQADTLSLFLVNPYRPWSATAEDLAETVRRVAGSARIENLRYVANPNFGPDTQARDVLKGLNELPAILGGEEPIFLYARSALLSELAGKTGLPILPIDFKVPHPLHQ